MSFLKTGSARVERSLMVLEVAMTMIRKNAIENVAPHQMTRKLEIDEDQVLHLVLDQDQGKKTVQGPEIEIEMVTEIGIVNKKNLDPDPGQNHNRSRIMRQPRLS